jgi:hypothetical protein
MNRDRPQRRRENDFTSGEGLRRSGLYSRRTIISTTPVDKFLLVLWGLCFDAPERDGLVFAARGELTAVGAEGD